MYGIYGNIYHHYTPNVSIYTIHGSYGCYDDMNIMNWSYLVEDFKEKSRAAL